jgi:osmotically inducible protein OsmC
MTTVIRKSEANWKGDLDNGHGLVSTESRVLTESKFSFKERVEGEGKDTNPEELMAAAAASCFAMALSKTLQDEDKVAEKLRVRADVSLNLDDGPKLTEMTLHVEGLIPDYSEESLKYAVAKTAENCPVFQLLKPGFEAIHLESVLQP